MVFTISSAMRSRPMLRKAPANRPATTVWLPSRRRARRPEASRIIGSTARTSVELLEKIIRGTRDQGRFRREQAQAIFFLLVRSSRQCDAKLQQGGVIRKFGDFVAGSRRPRHELPGHCPVAGMQRQRLFGRKTPSRGKPLFQIGGAETPERGIPGSALALNLVRTARNVPAFYDFLQKAIRNKAITVRTREVLGANGTCSLRGLELPQDFERLCEFFRRRSHEASSDPCDWRDFIILLCSTMIILLRCTIIILLCCTAIILLC